MNKPPVIISAPSGAGKSTIIQLLLKDFSDFEFSISSTTRPLRGSEKHGKHYYFIDEADFKKKIEENLFLEWAMVHGNYYGTEKKEIDRIYAREKIPIFDVDVQGAESLRKKLPDALYIFIIPPSIRVLHKRLTERKTDSAETIKVRIQNSLIEMNKYTLFDYIIVNDNLDIAVNNIKAVIKADACRTERLKDHMESLLEDNNDYTLG